MDRRSLFALFLIAVVLILTPYYFQLISPPITKTEKGNVEKSLNTLEGPTSLEHSTPVPQKSSKYEEKDISIDTPLYTAIISTRNGGSIKSYKLKNYLGEDSASVDLISDQNLNNLSLSFVNINGESLSIEGPWFVNDNSGYVEVFNASYSLEFSYNYNEKLIEKILVIDPNSYIIEITTNLSRISDQISGDFYLLGWDGGIPPTETNIKDEITYFNGYVYQAGDSYEFKKVAPNLKNGQGVGLEVVRGKTDWVAIRSKYFVSILLPEHGSNLCWAGHEEIMAGSVSVPQYSFAVGLNKDKTSSTSLYLGPLEYDTVKKVNEGIPSIMNFGFSLIRPISKGVLWLLKSIHEWIPNYGFVLILFSVLVKIVVFPLTKKSHQSSKEMQALQPEIAKLKEKHKNNPQKLNQATMGLYKEHGVNPLGGCLPILIQMPLLISLFQVFRSTIELRGAYFTGWITDLSAPDVVFRLPFSIPLYGDGVAVLPIIMGVTMFIQQKMMPTQASGQQKFMSYFMTGFFVLLFNGFPSGLNLYYTLFNVLTILQQKYLTPASPVKNLIQKT